MERAATDLAKYGFDSVEAQEVRWKRGGTEPHADYVCTSFHGKGMKRINPKGIGLQQQLLENFSELYGNRRSTVQFI
jgi:two-component sensor histidine kinase